MAEEKPKKRIGRPRKVQDRKTVALRIFGHMVEGLSLRKACIKENISPATFLIWVDEENLSKQYADARDALLEYWADQVLDIADEQVGSMDHGGTDNGAVQRNRLRVDSRKWILSKLAPKKYGDQVGENMDGNRPINISIIKPNDVDN